MLLLQPATLISHKANVYDLLINIYFFVWITTEESERWNKIFQSVVGAIKLSWKTAVRVIIENKIVCSSKKKS